jgi:hypothetical protein
VCVGVCVCLCVCVCVRVCVCVCVWSVMATIVCIRLSQCAKQLHAQVETLNTPGNVHQWLSHLTHPIIPVWSPYASDPSFACARARLCPISCTWAETYVHQSLLYTDR